MVLELDDDVETMKEQGYPIDYVYPKKGADGA